MSELWRKPQKQQSMTSHHQQPSQGRGDYHNLPLEDDLARARGIKASPNHNISTAILSSWYGGVSNQILSGHVPKQLSLTHLSIVRSTRRSAASKGLTLVGHSIELLFFCVCGFEVMDQTV